MTLTCLNKTEKPYRRKFLKKLKRVTTNIETRGKKKLQGFRDDASQQCYASSQKNKFLDEQLCRVVSTSCNFFVCLYVGCHPFQLLFVVGLFNFVESCKDQVIVMLVAQQLLRVPQQLLTVAQQLLSCCLAVAQLWLGSGFAVAQKLLRNSPSLQKLG